jgi:hypothetical protein
LNRKSILGLPYFWMPPREAGTIGVSVTKRGFLTVHRVVDLLSSQSNSRGYRPYTKNGVQQLDTLVPERAPFLRWLAEVMLDFSPAQSLKAFGNTAARQSCCQRVMQ